MAKTLESNGDLAGCSDELLARRFQAGCSLSFAELDRRFRPRLLYVLERRLRQRADAEDVVQQTLLRVSQKIHLYDPLKRLAPWVFTIAVRLASQFLRRGVRWDVVAAEEGMEPIDQVPSAEAQSMEREQHDQLWSLADSVLQGDEWTALWLFYGEDLSVKEIAQTLGRTRTSVSVLMYRARKKLLPHLRQYVEVLSDEVRDRSEAHVIPELSPLLVATKH